MLAILPRWRFWLPADFLHLLAALAAVCAVFVAPRAGAVELPDIVVFLSDDHSQADASTYGNPNIPTPRMSELAADGMKFRNCYVASPSCAPSRAALLTGLMPARNGAEGNHQLPDLNRVRSLVADLKAAGYQVAAFGKIAHQGSSANYGFDHVNDHPDGQLEANVRAWLTARTSTQPLCLFVGTSDPHVAWTSASSFDPAAVTFPPVHLDTPASREHRARYYEEIKEMDTLLGNVRAMATQYLRQDPLFIHTSDHGSQWAFGKWNLYDYGTRVPFIASWPGHIAPGTLSDAMISWVDILPTLIDIGGGTVPAGLDGWSFRGVLEGTATTHRERIFTTHTSDLTKNTYPSRAISTGEWKLIRNFRPDLAFTTHTDLDRVQWAGAYWNEWHQLSQFDPEARALLARYHVRPELELFHLPSDPWEMNNLAADPAQAELVGQLFGELDTWMTAQGDTVRLVTREHPILRPETWDPDWANNLITNGGFAGNDPVAGHFATVTPTGWTDGGANPAAGGATQAVLEIFDGQSADNAFLHPLGGQGNSSVDVNGRILQQTISGLVAGKSYELEFTLFNAAVAAGSMRSGVGEVVAGDGTVLATVSSADIAGQQHRDHTLRFKAPTNGTAIVRFRTTASDRADSGVHVDNVLLLPVLPPPGNPPTQPADLFLDSFNRLNHPEHGAQLTGMAGSRLASMAAGSVYYNSWEDAGSTEIRDYGLLLASGPGMTETALQHNFIGQDILDAGGFSVQMRLEELNTATSDAANRFMGFGVGLTAAEAETSADTGAAGPPYSFRGTVANPVGTADFFIDLAIDGRLRWWSNGALLGNVPVGKTSGYLTVSFSCDSFAAGAPVTAHAFLDGELIDLDPATPATGQSFQWQHSGANHIGLSARCTNYGRIDNLAIRTLPLSAALASAFTISSGLEGEASRLAVDHDGDGDSNFEEWLKGGDPNRPDADTRLLTLTPGADGGFHFSYLRLKHAAEAGLDYSFRYSSELGGNPATWDSFTPEETTSQPIGTGHELRTVRVPTALASAHSKLFVVLVVE